MLAKIRDRLVGFLRAKPTTLPVITENSRIEEVAILYPLVYSFIKERFGIELTAEGQTLTLKALVERYTLPPPQILYVEIQLHAQTQNIKQMTPEEARNLSLSEENVTFLDIREIWELKFKGIEGARPLTAELFSEIVTGWPKNSALILYCHFGVRSLDAAHQLKARGFSRVAVIRGGIDAWSNRVDPTIPKYEGSWC